MEPDEMLPTITARSQVISAPDAKGVEITHQFTSPRRSVDEWLASNGRLFRDDLNAAFEALSSNITSVYKPDQLDDPGTPAPKRRDGQ
jgi:hypothetical protein